MLVASTCFRRSTRSPRTAAGARLSRGVRRGAALAHRRRLIGRALPRASAVHAPTARERLHARVDQDARVRARNGRAAAGLWVSRRRNGTSRRSPTLGLLEPGCPRPSPKDGAFARLRARTASSRGISTRRCSARHGAWPGSSACRRGRRGLRHTSGPPRRRGRDGRRGLARRLAGGGSRDALNDRATFLRFTTAGVRPAAGMSFAGRFNPMTTRKSGRRRRAPKESANPKAGKAIAERSARRGVPQEDLQGPPARETT